MEHKAYKVPIHGDYVSIVICKAGVRDMKGKIFKAQRQLILDVYYTF